MIFDYMYTYNKLKEKFTKEQLREISFAFYPDEENIYKTVSKLDDEIEEVRE